MESLRTAATVAGGTVVIYAYVVVLLRVTGNRTLSSLRVYDFLVTVAMGTVVGTSAVQASLDGILRAVVAVSVLVALQITVAWASSRSSMIANALTNTPRLVAYDGAFLEEQMKTARLTREEIQIKMRANGFAEIEDVGAAILEANGDMSILPREAVSGGAQPGALRSIPVP